MQEQTTTRMIKETLEGLSRGWNFSAIKKHPDRSKLLSPLNSRTINTPDGYSCTFKANALKGDFRIFIKTRSYLVQWRTSPTDVDRWIYKPFDRTTNVDRIPAEDLFSDPKNIAPGEADLFEFLYPEIVKLLPEFKAAIRLMDQELLTMR